MLSLELGSICAGAARLGQAGARCVFRDILGHFGTFFGFVLRRRVVVAFSWITILEVGAEIEIGTRRVGAGMEAPLSFGARWCAATAVCGILTYCEPNWNGIFGNFQSRLASVSSLFLCLFGSLGRIQMAHCARRRIWFCDAKGQRISEAKKPTSKADKNVCPTTDFSTIKNEDELARKWRGRGFRSRRFRWRGRSPGFGSGCRRG